jgi:tripartite-type tricarboxylate transporter receptor subunit TctC
VLTRRHFLRLAAASAIANACAGIPAFAQHWPVRPVRLIVPFPPGGANDVVARNLAPGLFELWKQPVVIENRPGAGANIGIELAAHAAPDGHTILIVPIAMAVNRFIYPSLGYDPVSDFEPVTLICSEPNVITVPAASNIRSVRELIAQARSRPGGVTYASAGYGTSLHLCGELFSRAAGVQLTHVPYKGSGPAITDLVSGRVDAMFSSAGSILPHIRSGRIRGLAVTTLQRSPALPDLPTADESDLPGFNVSSWFAMFVPARTPPEVVQAIYSGTAAVLGQPSVRDKFTEFGARVVGSTPTQLANHLNSEMKKWGPIIKAANIRADA